MKLKFGSKPNKTAGGQMNSPPNNIASQLVDNFKPVCLEGKARELTGNDLVSAGENTVITSVMFMARQYSHTPNSPYILLFKKILELQMKALKSIKGDTALPLYDTFREIGKFHSLDDLSAGEMMAKELFTTIVLRLQYFPESDIMYSKLMDEIAIEINNFNKAFF